MVNGFLKVVLVDDELLVRDLLHKCVNWMDLGMNIVGEAASAYQAIDLMDRLQPDIVFTDICMPSMDGIELSRAILEKYPRTKVVIVTGYDDFEYAQRSIKAGVADFILKPINDEEITKVALKIKSMIEAEEAHRNEFAIFKEEFMENLPYLREKFFNKLLMNDLETAEIEGKVDSYHIPAKTALFQITVVEIYDDDQNLNPEARLTLRRRCYDLIRQHLESDNRMTIFLDDHQRTVVIDHDVASEFSTRYGDLQTILAQQSQYTVSIGTSNQHQGLQNIRLSYQEACEALHTQWIDHQKTSKIIQDVRHYLINHYNDPDLSLSTVAKAYYLNPSYLSRVFGQEVHQTFVEYLTEVRMEKAMQLIKATDLKAYQVSEAIGITDPHYFGICFKKYTGLSVGEYKKNYISSSR
ncbi:MAG TPA: hypothetical protein DDW50_13830 [Firmicutes bacterium]|jgi:two-component system, response regulator YesN|nr:hypothetical protein [Bacillota bacterium]